MSKYKFAATTVALAAVAAAPYAVAADSAARKTFPLKAGLTVRQAVPAAKDAAGASGVFSATLTTAGKWRRKFSSAHPGSQALWRSRSAADALSALTAPTPVRSERIPCCSGR